jgi:UDP-N-acetylglucosamine kinase
MDLSYCDEKNVQNSIKKIWSEDVTNANLQTQDKPTLIVIGGQPGSGKSHTQELVTKKYLNNNALFISGDSYREKHPHFNELNKLDNTKVYENTSKFVDEVTKKLSDKAIDGNLNVVMESTLKNFDKTKKEIDAFRDAGYRTKVVVVATRADVSWQRTISRAEKQRKNGEQPRVVDKEAHDNIVKILPLNVERLYNEKVCDDLEIRDCDGKEIYNSAKNIKFDNSILGKALHPADISKEPTKDKSSTLGDKIQAFCEHTKHQEKKSNKGMDVSKTIRQR